MSTHGLLELDIAYAILPIRKQVDTVVSTAKSDQLTQITTPLGKGCLQQRTRYVANSSLIPNFVETPIKESVGAPVIIEAICRPVSTLVPSPFNPCAQNVVAHAPGTLILDVLAFVYNMQRGKTATMDTSTVIVDLIHHRIWWRVAMVNSLAQVCLAPCEPPKQIGVHSLTRAQKRMN